jgi:hemerythrin-like domain-containing protein
MSTIKEYLSHDHWECDELFALIEADFDEAKAKYASVKDRFEKHFKMEEEVFFPQFEEKTGMSGGPTQIMRMEHSQMRGLLLQMEDAIEKNDADKFASLAETFVCLVQQHNSKEEQILYTMADRVFEDATALIEEMQKIA